MVLRSVGVLSAGKVMGALYALMGLVGSVFMGMFSIMAAMIPAQQQGNSPSQAAAFVFGIAMVFFIPLIYGIIGATFYNIIAGFIGGIELDLEAPTRAPISRTS